MQLAVYDVSGQVVAQLEVQDRVFGIEPNEAVMHQALVRQQANARAGTHDTLTRGRVRGGGAKPYRQKGTGRARQGSIRAPHYRGGGVVFGPHPRSYEQKMPRKMRRLAIRSALSQKVAEERVRLVSGLHDVEPRTKAFNVALQALGIESGSALVATGGHAENVQRAGGNLPNVRVLLASNLNVADLLKYDYLLLASEAVEGIEQALLDGAKADGPDSDDAVSTSSQDADVPFAVVPTTQGGDTV